MVEAPKIGFEADALKSIREPLISLSPVKYLPSRMIENDPEAYAYSLRIPPNTPVMLGPTSPAKCRISTIEALASLRQELSIRVVLLGHVRANGVEVMQRVTLSLWMPPNRMFFMARQTKCSRPPRGF